MSAKKVQQLIADYVAVQSDLEAIAKNGTIVLKTFGVSEVLMRALDPVSEQIQLAFIFGSVAKQEDDSKSDIDLLIISDNLSYSELFPLLEESSLRIGREINPTFYSDKEWVQKIKKKNNFVTNMLKQPKIFIIGTMDELNELGKSS